MPLVDSNLAALWDGGATSLYRAWNGDNPPTYIGYQRSQLQNYMGGDADKLIAALVGAGLTKGQRICLVGAGFGWVAEKFIDLDYGPMSDGTSAGRVCATDTSTWIQANKNGNATVSILNADVNASTGRTAIKNAFNLKGNATVDWIITEDVLPVLVAAGSVPGGNNEVVPFCQSCRLISAHVAHWVSPLIQGSDQDARLNWKSLADWKAWVAPDIVIGRGASLVA